MADDDRQDVDTGAPTSMRPAQRGDDPLIGFTINEVYEIRERIDAGGMGVVYLAWDRGLHRYVAVKTLRTRGLGDLVGSEALKEAERQARIDHPAFVAVMHAAMFRHPDGEQRAFFVMEYIRGGETLLAHAHAKHVDQAGRLRLFARLCEAVRHLHEREGLIHFDLKNANVLIDDRGHVRLIDLGVARALRDGACDLPGGTISHMSPEHVRERAADLDHRCDVWSLGVILYMLLSDGEAPFTADASDAGIDRTQALKRAICEDEPRRLDVDDSLWIIVERALAKSPSDRYPSVEAMLTDVHAILGEHDETSTAPAPSRSYDPRTRSTSRLILAAAIAAVSVLIAIPLTPLLAIEWSGAQAAFGRWLLAPAQVGPSAPLEQVSVIAFADSTDVETLAEQAEVEGVSKARVVSHRRLHGELCRRLVASGAAAVVFDIVFRSETEFDESFAQGVRALRDAGIGVVIAAPQWHVNEGTGRPIISERLWQEEVAWGCYALQEVGGQLVVPLVVQRDGQVMPSLPLAGFAAGRALGGDYTIALNQSDQVVELQYWRSQGDRPGARMRIASPDRIELTELQAFDETVPTIGAAMGYRPNDLIGTYYAATLERPAVEAETHLYEDVFSADDTTLRQWFSDRVVIVGNTSQAGLDFHPVGNETWPGVYLQAVATESLLRMHRSRAPRSEFVYALTGLAAWTGAWAAMGFSASPPNRRRLRRATRGGAIWISLSMLAAAAFTVGSVLLFRSNAWLLSPFFPAVATSLAVAGGMLAAKRYSSVNTFKSRATQGVTA